MHTLKSLEVLDLSHNQIRLVPDEISLIPSLMSLFLSHNLIGQTLDEEKQSDPALPWPSLETLDNLAAIFIDGNYLNLESVPEPHRELLHGIEFQHVPSRVLPRLFLGSRLSSLNAVELSRQGITHIVRGVDEALLN